RDLSIGFHRDIDESVERRRQSRPYVAAVIRAKRNSDHLEPRPIVQLEQLGHQIGYRMTTKVAGEIGEADLVVAPGRAKFETLRAGAEAVHNIVLRACELQRRVILTAQQQKRRDDGLPLAHVSS